MKSPNISPRGIKTRNAVSKKEMYVLTILLASASEGSAKMCFVALLLRSGV